MAEKKLGKAVQFTFQVCKIKCHCMITYYIDLFRIPANSHACGLKTSISRRLTLAGQFLRPDWKMWVVAVLLDTISKKYVNTDPSKERKPCVKWINDTTFLVISDFWSEKHWEGAHLRQTSADVGRLRQTSADFGRLRKTSDFFRSFPTSAGIFGSDRVVFKNPSTPRIKISRLYLGKSWQVYFHNGSLLIYSFLVKSNEWSVINAVFWLVELLLGYML